MPDRAEVSRYDYAAGPRVPCRLQHVAGADDIAFEDVAPMCPIAVNGRDLGRAVVEAPASLNSGPWGVEVKDIRVGVLDVQTVERFVGALAP